MANLFHLELLTPERVLFSGETEEVSSRTDGGEIAFLAHHEDFIGALDIAVVAVHQEGANESLQFAVHGGFVEVNESGVVILAGVAEPKDEIDVERARAALARAEDRLSSGESSSAAPADGEHGTAETPQEMSGAMLALLAPESPQAAERRARVRLEVAGAVPA